MLKKRDKVYLLRKNIKTKRPSDKLDHKKLGLFEIDKKTGPVNYRLKLPKTIKIYLTFHISLLEPVPSGSPPAPAVEAEPLESIKEYEIETILDYQYFGKIRKYLIKWLDYPDTKNI